MKRFIALVILIFFLLGYNFPLPAMKSAMPTVLPTITSGTAKGKPNIIFILTDDLDAAAMKYMPKMKSLIADQGETFPNYFVSESLCCPSRATTLRGQYPHNTQILGNSLPTGGFEKFYQLSEEKSTIAVWLQNTGYRTMLAGKYMNGYPPKTNPLYIPPGWSEWYSPVKGDPYSEYKYTLNENGKQVPYGNKPEDYGTDVYVGKTVDFIRRSAKEGKPFFVYLAPYAPHHPYTPAPRHANLFTDLKAPRTPNFNEADVSDKPAYIGNRSLLGPKEQNVIDEGYRKRLQSLQAIDEGIEAIVKALMASGKLDNTYIFFTSDNGYHMGNHRQVMGKVSPYEEEMRVTMMVRGPGVPASVTLQHLIGNIDLAPTWAELAGTKAADFSDGRSIVPLLRNSPLSLNQWRQAFLFEYGLDQGEATGIAKTSTQEAEPGLLEPQDQDEKDFSSLSSEKQKKIAVPPFRGIRFQTLSYVEYKTGEVELYNIKTDPYELQNLAAKTDPKLLKQLSERLRNLETCKAATCRIAEDAPLSIDTTTTSASAINRFGVFLSRQDVAAGPDFVNGAKDLGVGWVRINVDLGVTSPDYTQYLDAGINLILMISNQDPSNTVQTYGTPKEWPNAGFPFKSKDTYQQEIRSFLQPASHYLAQGRQVMVQAENECYDASIDKETLFWRGTEDQYLVQLQALYETVKSVNPNIPVVLTSFASAGLDSLIDPNSLFYKRQVNHVTKMLTQGKYDAIDLHFYGCVEDIPAKVRAVEKLLPAGHPITWISTENGGPDFINCKITPLSWKDDLAKFEQEQAKQVPLRLSACAENGGSVCLWFSLFDIKKSDERFSHLGLLDQDATPPRKKPAYYAFKAFVAKQKQRC